MKIILLYIIEMFFNQLSGRLSHIQSFSINLSLVAMLSLAATGKYLPSQDYSNCFCGILCCHNGQGVLKIGFDWVCFFQNRHY